ncbi:hypothetical protein M3P05_17375 [Sansalvadorimonas sp. 2012CJ34-2]|uniref:Uncharacterized protein n=1 Tax=Parendozoicomonas callyspongiae TaxID=2942213 RepID=A0ABT0PJY4_9GAMM|nr:hypothetical protein [Sansalvadorimonas sp. 2012CJ34-2]MCL6271692.1 hypothetical protein [Sansalvadorimonas sp. 2012CJ34-2]
MSKPELSHMIAYLKRLGVNISSPDPKRIEAEYFRKIYNVMPREQALEQLANSKKRPRKVNHSHVT